jgi:alpha-mannosidase
MLVVVPTVAEHDLPEDYADRMAEAGAVLIRSLHRRKDIVEQALAVLPLAEREATVPALVGDFLALGTVYLLTELLTRRMRYMSNLNETAFQDNLLAAATASVASDETAARERLQRCCDALYEARSHFYPVDTYLLDLTLVASTTLGDSLRCELAGTLPTNLLTSGEVIDQMASREPASLAAIRERLSNQTIGIIGGEYRETELPLHSVEEIIEQLEAGKRAYEQQLGVSPEIFGRRRFGLTPALPQILRSLEYKGALHFTLDDGRFAQADRSKTLWEGTGSTAIDAISRVPLDASDPASILALPEKLGHSMDYDFVSILSVAHWPSVVSDYYDDLRRISNYSPVLGRFVTAADFFSNTESAGTFSKFSHDEYRSPYLVQGVRNGSTDPLSVHMHRRQHRQRREATEVLNAWTSLLAGKPRDAASSAADAHDAAQHALAGALIPAGRSQPSGVLLINPLSFPRRVVVDVGQLESAPLVEGPVIAVDASEPVKTAVVEMPALGFAWVGPGDAIANKSKPRKPIARENMLVNELCEVTLDPESGGIRSVRDLHARGNRVSQQLAFRLPGPMPMPASIWRDPDDDVRYSQMVADSIAVTSTSTVLGELTSRGRLSNADGRQLATFVQTTRLAAESPLIQIDVELVPNEEPLAEPWSSYYACRFAWSDGLAELRRSVQQASYATELKRLEAPDFVEIVSDKSRTAILTGGLPYHQRIGSRMLDSLLIVRGETARRFRLGIAIENPYPWRAADELTSPSPVVGGLHPRPGAEKGWLFHIDAKNVIATHWSPVVHGQSITGFRVRLQELAGRGTSVTLRSFRNVARARHIDLRGEAAENLSVEEDRIRFDLGGHELFELEANWT